MWNAVPWEYSPPLFMTFLSFTCTYSYAIIIQYIIFFTLNSLLLNQLRIKNCFTFIYSFSNILSFLMWIWVSDLFFFLQGNLKNLVYHFCRWLHFFFKDFIYSFLERGEEKENERERNINVWLPLVHPILRTWPATQACALTGNWTGDPLVCSPHSIHWAAPARAAGDFWWQWIPSVFV